MTPKERAAMQQALEALESCNVGNWSMAFDEFAVVEAITALREALDHSGEANEMVSCTCGDLYPADSFGAGFIAATGHCQNCDAAEQAKPNSTFMEGYRIGLAEMREKCADICETDLMNEMSVIGAGIRYAKWIRAIKFEGDTGFRPVSEMIAEHKQDTKKAAAIEKAKMRKATRDEKTVRPGVYEVPVEQAEQEPVAKIALKNCIYFDSIDFNQNPPYLRYDTGDSTSKENWTIYCDIQEELRKNGYELTDSDVDHDTVCGDVTPMAAPVRTKDLTDDEIADALYGKGCWRLGVHPVHLREYRRVIQADREKNK